MNTFSSSTHAWQYPTSILLFFHNNWRYYMAIEMVIKCALTILDNQTKWSDLNRRCRYTAGQRGWKDKHASSMAGCEEQLPRWCRRSLICTPLGIRYSQSGMPIYNTATTKNTKRSYTIHIWFITHHVLRPVSRTTTVQNVVFSSCGVSCFSTPEIRCLT